MSEHHHGAGTGPPDAWELGRRAPPRTASWPTRPGPSVFGRLRCPTALSVLGSDPCASRKRSRNAAYHLTYRSVGTDRLGRKGQTANNQGARAAAHPPFGPAGPRPPDGRALTAPSPRPVPPAQTRGTRDGPTPNRQLELAPPRRFHTNYVCMRGNVPRSPPRRDSRSPPLGPPFPR